MPTISLRLTEEEHAALREWAHGSRRSLQREIVFRLFSGLSERDDGSAGMTTTQPEAVGRISRDAEGPEAQPLVPRSESPDPHFKPDFK